MDPDPEAASAPLSAFDTGGPLAAFMPADNPAVLSPRDCTRAPLSPFDTMGPLSPFLSDAPTNAFPPVDAPFDPNPPPFSPVVLEPVAPPPLPPPPPPPAPRLWTGLLQIGSLSVAMHADPIPFDGRLPLVDATGWPRALTCTSATARRPSQLGVAVQSPAAQWCAQLSVQPSEDDPARMELYRVAEAAAREKMCFEVASTMGSVWVWASPNAPHAFLAVFAPAPPLPPPSVYPPGPLPPLWRGQLHIHGHAQTLQLAAAAYPYAVEDRQRLTGSRAWPRVIALAPERLQPVEHLVRPMYHVNALWAARFAAVDSSASEVLKLRNFAKVLKEKHVALRIECMEGGVRQGRLVLWGWDLPGYGHCVMGAYLHITRNSPTE